MPHVLIVDDARDVAEVVAFGARLNWQDAQVRIASSGSEALDAFNQENFDLLVLDLSLPAPDGFELCRRIRESSNVPILILSVRDSAQDKIRALDLGADDYLSKPFNHSELLARLRALYRRGGVAYPTPGSEPHGAFDLDHHSKNLVLHGETIRLTSTEFRLLEELVRHPKQVLTHQFLLEQVWGPEYVHELSYLKVFIRRLRAKLGDDAENARYIQTELGVGYSFTPID